MSYDAEVLADSPLSYWKLGGDDLATVISEVGGPSLIATSAGPITIERRDGIGGGGAAAVSDASYYETSAPVIPDGTFSIELWLKAETGAVVGLVFGFQVPGAPPDVSLIMRAAADPGNNYVDFFREDAVNFEEATKDTVGLVEDAWYYVVGTYDGAAMVVYLNAVELVSQPSSVSIDPVTTTAILSNRGHNDLGSPWAVYERPAIYDHALSPERIAAHYTAGIAVDAPPVARTRWPAKTIFGDPRPTVDLEETVCGTGRLESTICRWSP